MQSLASHTCRNATMSGGQHAFDKYGVNSIPSVHKTVKVSSSSLCNVVMEVHGKDYKRNGINIQSVVLCMKTLPIHSNKKCSKLLQNAIYFLRKTILSNSDDQVWTLNCSHVVQNQQFFRGCYLSTHRQLEHFCIMGTFLTIL